MDILVNVANQKLKIATNLKSLVAGTQEFVRFVFNLTGDWDNLMTFAQFSQNGVSYNQYLDEDNSAYLPAEIGVGTCTLMLYGSNQDTIATTNYLTLSIDENILVSDANSTEISESLYTQLVTKVNALTTWNGQNAADLIAVDTDLQRQINTKAAQTDLTTEIARAKAAEKANSDAIATKANQTEVDQLSIKVTQLESNEVVAQLIEDAVANEMAAMLSGGTLANLTIQDNSISRSKVDSDFNDTLIKADTAMQPSVYDPQNLKVDIYSYAQGRADTVQNNLNTVKTEIQDAYKLTDTLIYKNLGDTIRGAVTLSRSYAQALLADYKAFTIVVVDELPTVGEPMTFYLVPNRSNTGYDKYWWITDSVGDAKWDVFGSSSTLVVTELPVTGDEDVDYILKSSAGCLYYKWIDGMWQVVAGSIASVSSTLPATGNEFTDYYVLNSSGSYVHYRYINGNFHAIGSDAYTKDEIDEKIALLTDGLTSTNNNITALGSRVEANETNIGSLSNAINNVQQEVNNLDIEGATYYATYDTDNVFTLYEVDDNVETIKSRFTIQGGGGGGGQSSTTNLSVERITNSPVVATPTDRIELKFFFSSTDSDGQDVDGTYTWKMGSTTISTGVLVQGENTFDMTDYCNIGTQKFTLIVTDEGGNTVVKTWNVQIVDVRIESSFSDRITYPVSNSVNFTYTPYGSVSKTIHFILDGVELNSVTTNASGTLQSYSLPAQTHGAHLLECFITATINNISVETEHIYKDIIWYDENSSIPVIGCIYRNDYFHVVKSPLGSDLDEYYILNDGTYSKAPYKEVTNPSTDNIASYYELSGRTYVHTEDTTVNTSKTYYVKEVSDGISYYSHNIYAKQYDTTSIQYYVFNPNTSMPTVTRTADGNTAIQTLTSNSDVWAYKSATTGERNLTISCGSTSVTITLDVAELDIDVSPVTANLAFDFNPTGLSNSSTNRLWVDENNSEIAMSVSDNFDWSSGGYQLDSDGTQYFCVKAGTTAKFGYNLFGVDPKTLGMEFKFIFKTVNVKSADAQFLTCLDKYSGSNVGLQMNTHEAYLNSSSKSLYIPYSEEDKIEFEFNINPLDQENVDATSLIMSYEDGVGMRPMIYDSAHRLYQYTPSEIIVGSSNCDVHIYRMKAYTSSLTDSNILSNFIADAPNADEMIARYNRNQIYDENNNLTPESLANACPDLKIIKIECPQFTNNKSNFVKYTNVQCIHKNGDPVLDNWTFTNCYHSGQGTTSNEYGYAGRNIDIICCMDGVNQYSSKITFDENYKTTLTLGDGTKYENGTGKVSLSRTSVPNNWFNIKVNIASSENANNALLQKRYNDYLPYTPASKSRDKNAKNDMEFFNCVVFVKETGNSNGTPVSRREFTDGDWHFYAIGNIGDSKKTDSTRANNPDDMKEFCIEISDNTLPNAGFQTGVYATYTPVTTPTNGNLSNYYELDESIYRPTKDTTVTEGKTYYTRGSVNYSGNGTMIYPITEAQWNNANNVKRINLQYSFDKDDTDDYAASFEFRYDMGGETRDGDTTGLSSAEQSAQRERNKQIFRDFYKWVVTATDSDFVNQLSGWFIQESALYWYLFTERYTMIDNRAKNTFWHFGDIGVYRKVPCPSSMFMDYYYEKSVVNGAEVYTLTSDTTVNSNKDYYWSYAFEMWDYDNDTALGINNSGELTMPYGKEDTDYRTEGNASSGYIFNAADSVFWRRIRLLMDSQLRAMYQTLDSSNCWSSTSLINEYDAWQAQFPEELWRLDIERKYYRTYRGEGLNAGATPSPTPRYLEEMMNGRKKYQRRQFERDMYAYMGTKYLSSSIMADKIEFRCNTPIDAVVTPNYDLTIVPYSDMYLSVKFGNTNAVQIRAKAGNSYNVKCPIDGTMDDTMFVIYCASRIQALNDISACYIHDNDFSSASKLQTLIIGNTTVGYENLFLTTLNLGSSPLLEMLDIRNCPNLTGSLNLSSCINLNTLRAEGTALTAVTFANYGKIATAHLPDTINTLSMRNLHYLNDLQVSYDNLESLTVENSDIDEYSIVLDAVDTLQYLRLVGIDWTLSDTTLLNSILAMNDSFLSGRAYVSGSIRNQEIKNYEDAWDNLELVYNPSNLVTQYLVKYVNADDKSTVLFTVYVDRGATPPDPYALGLIDMPTLESDAQYSYSFGTMSNGSYVSGSGWDNITDAVLSNKTITAVYTTTTRKYTVTWYSRAGLSLGSVEVEYGSDVCYDYLPTEDTEYNSEHTYYQLTGGNYVEWTGGESGWSSRPTLYNHNEPPTNISEEGSYIYNVFAGWDKSTGFIKEDTDVYAIWDRAELPSTGKDLKNMTPAEIFAIAKSNLVDNYLESKDYTDIELGHDFNFSNVESTTFVGKQGTISTDELYLDGATAYNTGIKLFGKDEESFTLAIDFRFLDTATNNTLVSCFEEDGSEGFRLRYNGNANIQWGNQNHSFGYQKFRDIVVIRHKKGDAKLYIYASNENNTSANFSDTITRIESTRNRITNTESTLSIGAVRFVGDGGYDDYGKGVIYWCKLWHDDLGDTNCRQLAAWCHEPLRAEFTASNVYRLAGNTSQRTSMSFIPNDLLGDRGHQMNTTNVNAGGWDKCLMRTGLMPRLKKAFPTVWQSMIKQVKISASAGNQSSEIIVSNDDIYLSSVKEVDNGQTNTTYLSEGSYNAWFSANNRRAKFRGSIVSDTATYYTNSSDPNTLDGVTVSIGDVWQPNGGNNTNYIFLSNTEILRRGLTIYGTATDVGGWVSASNWWLRSPNVSNSTNFWSVTNVGNCGNNTAGNSYGVCPCFSI